MKVIVLYYNDLHIQLDISSSSSPSYLKSSPPPLLNCSRSMKGLSKKVDSYPAIFAVIMRRPGASRVLECHAFACHNEEDAVAAAATLYRALLSDMDANVNMSRRPRQSNGVGCVSLASVVSSDKEG